jgi:hypothetical protein
MDRVCPNIRLGKFTPINEVSVVDSQSSVQIKSLVDQLDQLVSRGGAAVVDNHDAILFSGYDDLLGQNIDDQEWWEIHMPRLANRNGLMRFGIEHLKAAVVGMDSMENCLVEADTRYLTGEETIFGFVLDEKTEQPQPAPPAAPWTIAERIAKAGLWILGGSIVAFFAVSFVWGAGMVIQWLF